MPLGGVFVLYSAFFQYCSTVHVPEDIKTTSGTQTWEKKRIPSDNNDWWKEKFFFFFLLKHSRLTICRHFKVLGRKNHMLSFFRLTSVKCCRLTSYPSTQKSLTPSVEFEKFIGKKKSAMEVEFQLIDLLNVNVVLRRELLLTLRLIFFLYQILSYCHRDRFLHAWVEETERALVLEGHESCQVFENHRGQKLCHFLIKKKRSQLQIQLPFKKR